MKSNLETLIDPNTGMSIIPPDIHMFVNGLPMIVKEDLVIPTRGIANNYDEKKMETTTLDDIAYDMIMSCLYNNDIIGW